MDITEPGSAETPPPPAETLRAPPAGRFAWVDRRALLLIAILALALRLVLPIYMGPDIWRRSSDAPVFHVVALNLMNGDGYADRPYGGGDQAARFPALPTLMAGVYTLVGDPNSFAAKFTLQVLLCIIGAAAVPLVFHAASLLGMKRRVALLAALLYAALPSLVFISSVPLTENLLVPLTLVLVIAVLRLAERPDQWRWAVLAGLTLGIELLNRSTIAMFAPLIGLWLWRRWGMRGFGRAAARTACIAAVSAAVLVPWIIRNAAVLDGAFVPFTTAGGWGFYAGNNPEVFHALTGERDLRREFPQAEGEEGRLFLNVGPTLYGVVIPKDLEFWSEMHKRSEVERDLYCYEKGREFIREEPGEALMFAALKCVLFWAPYNHPVHYVNLALVLAVAAAGLFLGRLDHGRWWLVYWLILTRIAAAAVYFSVPRYKFPIMPFVAMLAAAGAVAAWERWRKKAASC
jgi:4-amino-4-deoxy-L-arabinose transferase-like glycosyltransferase